MRICSQCKTEKPLDAFARNRSAKDGLHTWCKFCKAHASRVWWDRNRARENAKDRANYAADGTRARENGRRWHHENHARSLENKRKWKLALHGLTDGVRAEMYSSQGGRCAVCARPMAASDLCVDHDHETKEIRGLLCRHCNVGLGHFFDSPDKLRAAANYLEDAPGVRGAA